ncbi:hypothetical protein [Flammeovirga aprica]|uniref:Uncharacterized protein n=1 Tax=Flammeovirga aprica JL-4 TaxID=694437 RepID=A0A7X9X9Q5_9BACT|nr:hypothetical protein [Flammeovirga aprica]NME69027.1 hypothetical protein [Flammeovirga aprica JL-4]
MKRHKFEFKTSKSTGRAVMEFRETGELYSISVTFKHKGKYFNKDQMKALLSTLPITLSEVANNTRFKVKKLADPKEDLDTTTAKKVATWTKLYKNKFQVAYKMTPKEIGQLKGIQATSEEIEAYLNSSEWNMKAKTVTEFCRGEVLNTIRRLIAQGVSTNNRFLDYYDASFESELKMSEMKEYWKHLRSLGFRVVMDSGKKK